MRSRQLVAVVTCLLALAVDSTSAGQTWDFVSDFSIASGNPNGDWTYGDVSASAFRPYTNGETSELVLCGI
jgi:hypothetical protein